MIIATIGFNARHAQHRHVSRLENIPAEIRHLVLSAVSSMEDLRALVRASPVYHQQYLLHRRLLLWNCLLLQMGNVFVDVLAVHSSGSKDFQTTRNYQGIRDFIVRYKTHRQHSEETLSKPPSIEEVVEIGVFYMSTIRPLIQRYILWTRQSVALLSSPAHLSVPERTRILRAFYRFQLFCNLFGLVHDFTSTYRTLSVEERLRLFLCIYEPWEIEEIACVDYFAKCKFEEVYRNIELDLLPGTLWLRFSGVPCELSLPTLISVGDASLTPPKPPGRGA